MTMTTPHFGRLAFCHRHGGGCHSMTLRCASPMPGKVAQSPCFHLMEYVQFNLWGAPCITPRHAP